MNSPKSYVVRGLCLVPPFLPPAQVNLVQETLSWAPHILASQHGLLKTAFLGLGLWLSMQNNRLANKKSWTTGGRLSPPFLRISRQQSSCLSLGIAGTANCTPETWPHKLSSTSSGSSLNLVQGCQDLK